MTIVNADDFGRSDEVNRAIVACFQEGVVSSTTIMANMPAFELGCDLSREYLLSGNIGIHINITEGEPLTHEIRRTRTFCDISGAFAFKRYRHFYLTDKERAVLATEVAAQIERCRAQGLPLTHADSHSHVHAELPVFMAICPVLKHYGIRRVRPTRNTGPMSIPLRAYKSAFNALLSYHDLRGVDHFGDVFEYTAMKEAGSLRKASFEIMVHPGYSPCGELTDVLQRSGIVDVLRTALQGVIPQPYGLE